MTSQGSRHVEDEAWVTLATNDTYALGALVLARSLIRVATTRKLAVLVTPGLSESMRSQLRENFDHVQEVNILDSSDAENLALLTRPDLGVTFTKLHCWRLTQFKKCVFMDADTLVMQNCDEVFDREELSAAPDVGWPDCFNSGVFVYRPSNETYTALLRCALTTGSFDGGDQGLLNMYFRDWATKDISKHLPFVYNMTSSVAYFYLPAYIHFGKDVKIVHFIGPVKPWNHHYNTTTGKVDQQSGAFHSIDHLQLWWDIFVQEVQPNLKPELAGLAAYLSQLSLGAAISPEHTSQEDRARQFAWEQGHIDYMGADSFANIQRKLDDSLSATTGAQATESSAPTDPQSEEPKSHQAPSEPLTVTDSLPSSAEPVNIVSCPVAAPTTPVHVSSVHFPDVSQIPAEPEVGAVSTPPASGIPAATRMDIIPAIPRTPPILPSTPIMLPPPPDRPPAPPASSFPDATPEVAPDVPVSLPTLESTPTTPSVTPATPSTPPAAVATPIESPIPPVIPSPTPVTPSTPPAGPVIPPPRPSAPATQPTAVSAPATTQPIAPVPPPRMPGSQPVTSEALVDTADASGAVPPPPLPPRVPAVTPEATIVPPSVPPSQAEAAPAAATQPKSQGASGQKSGGKKSNPAQAQAAPVPAAPARKGDKGKPPKK